jgi:hypothetical protein
MNGTVRGRATNPKPWGNLKNVTEAPFVRLRGFVDQIFALTSYPLSHTKITKTNAGFGLALEVD